jgi:K+/H+ antiporter YhaU regulatory subunit KhtT
MTTTLFVEKEGGWKAIVGNVGDGMILVVDKDGKLKPDMSLHPKKLNTGSYLTAQSLGVMDNRQLFEVEIIENLQASDKIIHLTPEASVLFDESKNSADVFSLLTDSQSEKKILSVQNIAHNIAKYLVDKKKTAEGTITVLEIPDEKVELVRAFLETNDPNHIRSICEDILEKNFLAQQDHNDYMRVSAHLRTQCSHSSDKGVMTENSMEALEASYSNQETNIQNFMFHYEQIRTAISQVTSRQEKWEKFGNIMKECTDLTRIQFAKLYAAFSRHPDLRGHCSPIIDFFLGIKKTKSEQKVLEMIRPIYKDKIIKGLNQSTISETERKAIGENALQNPLICEHKYPFWRGGFGATRAKREILREIEKPVSNGSPTSSSSFERK